MCRLLNIASKYCTRTGKRVTSKQCAKCGGDYNESIFRIRQDRKKRK